MLAALGGMLFGYDAGVTGGALPLIAREFGWDSPFRRSIVIASVLLGAAVGAVAAGRLAERLGRRRLILGTALTFFVAVLGCSAAPDAPTLLAFRVLLGTAIGSVSIAVPLYLGEIAPPERRGALVSLNQLAITIGILAGQVVSYLLTSAGSWRLMVLLALVPAALLGLGMLGGDESPVWLARHGHAVRAGEVLERFRESAAAADHELAEIVRATVTTRAGVREMLSPEIRPALVVGVGLAIIAQVTGVNTVIYYAPTLLSSAGLGAHAAIGGAVLIGSINVLVTMLAIRVLDVVGRRRLLIGGTATMAVALAAMGLVFLGQPATLGSGRAMLAIVALGVYIGAFAIGLGPVFWLLIAEIYPARVRGAAASLAGLVNWLANLAVAVNYLSVLAMVGRTDTYWLLTGITLLSLLFIYARVPETKGRSLSAIEAAMAHSAARGTPRSDEEEPAAGLNVIGPLVPAPRSQSGTEAERSAETRLVGS